MIFWLNVLILRYISFSLLEAIWYSVLHRQAIKSGLIATALKAQKFRLNYCFIYETFKQIHVVVNNYLFSSWYNLFSCFTNRYYLLQSFFHCLLYISCFINSRLKVRFPVGVWHNIYRFCVLILFYFYKYPIRLLYKLLSL